MAMESTVWVTAVLCWVVGITLGLFGGGGSILTVPIFIYAAHYPAAEAIALSLVTAGAASLLASIRYLLRGLVNLRLVLIFFGSGSLTAFAGAQLTDLLSERSLLLLFGGLMVVIAWVLYLRASAAAEEGTVVCRPKLGISVGAGALTGFLTGFLGVGGGFLIVPAIALLMRCSMQTAIGTSLVIVTLNSFAGYWGHLRVQSFPLMPAALFVLAAALGTFVGSRLGVRARSEVLQRGFAGLIFAVGIFLIAVNSLR